MIDPQELAARAVALAERWTEESAAAEVDPAAQRLAGVLRDPKGLPFTLGFVDGVMRPESLSAAAEQLHRVAPLVPGFLPWYLKGAVQVGGAVAPMLPAPTVPIARRVLREMVGHLIVDARPDKLGPAIAKLREGGARLNLNLLGEAVLGEAEARRRLDGIHDLIRRDDVDYVSVKVSAIASHISMWAFDDVVDDVSGRLLPLYLSAAESGTFVNLDMEEYRDLDLTIAVFTRLLEHPALAGLEAGIVLQAYLPDALPALQELTAWATQRVDAGGARIKIRLVKGANLAMERVDAIMHGWPVATYSAKVDTDANYLRCLDWALRPEHTRAVRIGIAGHNLFDIAYAWLLAEDRGLRGARGAGEHRAGEHRAGEHRAGEHRAGEHRAGEQGEDAHAAGAHAADEQAHADWPSGGPELLTDPDPDPHAEPRTDPDPHTDPDTDPAPGPHTDPAPTPHPSPQPGPPPVPPVTSAADLAAREADIEIEMLLGMAQGQVAAVAREVGHVLLYVPVVRPDEFDVAISYLVRRLEENASSENFLSAAFALAEDPELFERERARFVASVVRSAEPSLAIGPNRRQDRAHEQPRLTRPSAGPQRDDSDAAMTRDVLGIARAAAGPGDTVPLAPTPEAIAFGGAAFVETAVFSTHESGAASGAPGFQNAPDSDPSLPANREWAADVRARIPDSTAGDDVLAAARIDDEERLDSVVSAVSDAAATWGALPATERASVLERAAVILEARRGELIEVAASETGKVFAEADVEVSEAVDFANYYAATARELDRVSGAVFEPSQVTVVTPPWNFPLAIPAGGVLAALAAGSGVVFKPAPQARRCAAVIADALWEAGVPRALLALVDIEEGALGEQLITHPAVDRVILTGSWETAALFRSWRRDLPLLAETSGKNAIIVTPSADLDLAASDVVRSAFGHAGQKCSAASLVILVGPVARSRRFARQLVDATRSLRVGPPTDPRAEVGPIIEAPTGKLQWALTTLDDGERWLVQPQPALEDAGGDDRDPDAAPAGRLWSPGIRTGVQPGSRFHLEEFFGPVLGVMHAPSLSRAIELQNAVAYGLTAGLHTQNPDDLALWLDTVQAGNLYVNRGITGAIVQRQPFGGWKRSSVGPGAKAGGPNYLIGLGTWRPSPGGPASSTLHLRGLDTRIAELIEAAQRTLDYPAFEQVRRAALSDAIAWDREFGRVKDVSGLGVERNLFRYRPVDVILRATGDAAWQSVLRVIIAGVRAGSQLVVSLPVGLPPEIRHVLSDLDVTVAVETESEWTERVRAGEGSRRVRLVGSVASVADLRSALAEAVDGDPDVAVYDHEVTTAGRIELLPFLHEQSISITAHRYGNPDRTFESVI